MGRGGVYQLLELPKAAKAVRQIARFAAFGSSCRRGKIPYDVDSD
ncbi:hypothetical protein M2401_005711 [Pseudomonas sp. JUb42]|jgi:hypothetical protein|nr:hypothetical protein [Pseudomonas sp. JUb42]